MTTEAFERLFVLTVEDCVAALEESVTAGCEAGYAFAHEALQELKADGDRTAAEALEGLSAPTI